MMGGPKANETMKNTIAANADDQPERRRVAAKGEAASSFGGWLSSVRTWPKQTKTFLGEVRTETQKVTWPSRTMVKATTIVVIVTVFFFGLYFAILDYVFSELVGRLLQWGS
jgi:preprotein translocase subunit SecE